MENIKQITEELEHRIDFIDKQHRFDWARYCELATDYSEGGATGIASVHVAYEQACRTYGHLRGLREALAILEGREWYWFDSASGACGVADVYEDELPC